MGDWGGKGEKRHYWRKKLLSGKLERESGKEKNRGRDRNIKAAHRTGKGIKYDQEEGDNDIA